MPGTVLTVTTCTAYNATDSPAVLPSVAFPGRIQVNVPWSVKTQTITRGLKYSLATGNWGQQGTQGVRAGVSQVSRGGGRLEGRGTVTVEGTDNGGQQGMQGVRAGVSQVRRGLCWVVGGAGGGGEAVRGSWGHAGKGCAGAWSSR